MIEIFPEGSDLKNLKRVKFGIDPTFPRLHLGHLVPLRLVRQLQEQGKEITIVLGTFTAQMGDPSGRDKTRPILSKEEVEENANSIQKQVHHFLGSGVTFHRNGITFNNMDVPELMQIVSKFTVAQLLDRDAFQKRIEEGKSIALHELIVPILQGWDSCEVMSEIEVGGTDQLFNFKIARRLQELDEDTIDVQVCMMTPIINGTDGRKMSKSLDNCVFLDEDPTDVFGKCMSVSDEVMEEWIPLLTDGNKEKLMARKKKMAFDIVEQLFDLAMAQTCLEQFESTIQNRNLPDVIDDIRADNLMDAVVKIRGCSKSEARRLLKSGAVKIDGVKATEESKIANGQIVKVGKRDFARID